MIAESWKIVGSSGECLSSMVWRPEGEVKAVLQVVHGMTEHMGRYEALAKELTEEGIAVAGFDLRGHGVNPGDLQVASFGEGGWEKSLEEIRWYFEKLDRRFSGKPHYMLGFSLGSFLLREYLGQYPEGVAGAVIAGTGMQSGQLLSFVQGLVKGQIRKGGFDGTTKLVRKLSFGTYNGKFKPNRTSADWLCSDQNELDAYLADPLCRKDISSGLFWQMLEAMKRTGSAEAYASWNKEMPVLLLSGTDDPVGDMGRGVKEVCRQMMQAGLKKVRIELILGGRHDIFHEEANGGAKKVRTTVKAWISDRR